MEVIELNSYTTEEKFHIAKDYLIKKEMKKHNLKASEFKVSNDAIYSLIECYTAEAGVRNLKKSIASLCRKVNGLAWTRVGGTLLPIEVSALDGTGKIELTGNLGDVMQESAKTAVSYIRSRAADFGIDSNFYKNKDIHIHAPEAAVPKDGPSAGLAITTAKRFQSAG